MDFYENNVKPTLDKLNRVIYVIGNQLFNMSEAISSKEILHELKAIREDINYIKGHMVDIDSILTEEDYLSLQEYRKEK